MKIKFLQIAIAQWEHNNKLKGYFHCTIGVNLDTNELTRIYPVELFKMRKNGVYIIDVEPMNCHRENSYKPIHIEEVGMYNKVQTNKIINSLNITSISKMNQDKISMGIIDVSDKLINIEINKNYIDDMQFDLFDDTDFAKIKSLENKNFSSKIKKDIRIKFPTNETAQGFRDLSYNEFHFFVGLEKNNSIPQYYNSNLYNRMIVGNLRNHRSIFIGLCLFKS
jgi:hypothetical protein